MSTNRENAVWKSPDGTWNIGFYDYRSTGDPSSEDYDHEWDVEYDHGNFWWVSTGHSDERAAMASWDGSNPGSHNIYSDPGSPEVTRFEDMAAETMRAAGLDYPQMTDCYPHYSGPAKQRDPLLLAGRIDAAELEHWGHRLGGYANGPDPRLPYWREEIEYLDPDGLSPNQMNVLAGAHRVHAERLRAKVEASQRRREDQRRRGTWGLRGNALRDHQERQRRVKEVEEEAMAEVTRREQEASRLANLARAMSPEPPSRPYNANYDAQPPRRPGTGPGVGTRGVSTGPGVGLYPGTPGRRKTTPASTSGSFAPHSHRAPDVSLTDLPAGGESHESAAADPFGDDSFWS